MSDPKALYWPWAEYALALSMLPASTHELSLGQYKKHDAETPRSLYPPQTRGAPSADFLASVSVLHFFDPLLDWVAKHLIDLHFVAVKVGSSTDPTGLKDSYSNNPLAGHKCTKK